MKNIGLKRQRVVPRALNKVLEKRVCKQTRLKLKRPSEGVGGRGFKGQKNRAMVQVKPCEVLDKGFRI